MYQSESTAKEDGWAQSIEMHSSGSLFFFEKPIGLGFGGSGWMSLVCWRSNRSNFFCSKALQWAGGFRGRSEHKVGGAWSINGFCSLIVFYHEYHPWGCYIWRDISKKHSFWSTSCCIFQPTEQGKGRAGWTVDGEQPAGLHLSSGLLERPGHPWSLQGPQEAESLAKKHRNPSETGWCFNLLFTFWFLSGMTSQIFF